MNTQQVAMKTDRKPVVVLVHGAWHVPQHFDDFVKQLQLSGFEVLCPLLPTCNESKRLEANMYSDAEEIRDIVTNLTNKKRQVFMLLHSYGGAVGTEAVKGLSASERALRGLEGGVIHLFYMCGFMLQEGECVGGASLPRPDPEPVERDEETGTTFLCQPPVQLFYADVENEIAKKMEGLLVRQSGAAMTDTLTFAAWKHIPTTYLRTEEDQVLFPEWQDRQIAAARDAGAEITVKSLRTSHSPWLSAPQEVIAMVEDAASICRLYSIFSL